MRVPIEVLQPGRSRSILLTQIWIFVLSQQTNFGTSIAKAPQKSAWICHSFAAPTAFKSQGKRRRWCSMPENQTRLYMIMLLSILTAACAWNCMKARARHSRFFCFFPGFKQLKPHFTHKGQMVLRKASGSFWPTVPCLGLWHDSLWHAPDIKQ